MDLTNASASNPGPSVVGCAINLKTDDDTIRIPTDEVSDNVKETKRSTISESKNAEKHAKKRKISRKRKKPDNPSTLEKEAKKASKKRNAASAAAVPSDVECTNNHSTDEDILETPSNEVSNKMITNNPADSDKQNTKKPAKDGKLSNKRKKLNHQHISGTVTKKSSKKQNRVSVTASPSVECPSNINTCDVLRDDNIEIQSDEIPNKLNATKNPASSNVKNAKKPAKHRKNNLKKEKPDILPMLQMVKALNAMRKLNEAAVEIGTSVVESPTIQTDIGSMENQSEEVTNKNNASNERRSSGDRNTINPIKDRKISSKKKNLTQAPILQTVAKANDNLANLNSESVKSEPVESAPNPDADVNSMRIHVSRVSNKIMKTNKIKKPNKIKEINKIKKTNNPAYSRQKIAKAPTIHRKVSLKRKMPDNLPISQMVMDAIKSLKKRNGSSVDAIIEYMEGQYRVNAKLIKRYVTRYMKTAVQKGILDQLGEVGDGGRFKIKRVEKFAKDRKRSITRRKRFN